MASGRASETSQTTHPCLRCGACCACYRVSFYWAEPVPEALTVRITPFLSAMRGTEAQPPRCVALQGTIGAASCSIYADRPTPCREFGASWEHGVHEPRCDEARARHGLLPLVPADYEASPPRAA